MYFGKEAWTNFERGIEKEWLVTNGLGGYASSTIICANTRKYHGLLVASLAPPVQRTLFLAKLDERVETGEGTFNLAANQTAGGVTESGFIHLQKVVVGQFPVFLYSFADIFLYKQIFMVYGKNTTVVLYRIYNGGQPAVMRLHPLVNRRNFHWTSRKGQVDFSQQPFRGSVVISGSGGGPLLRLACSAGCYGQNEDWYYNMFYLREQERGLDAHEDHYMPGCFSIPLGAGEEKTVTFTASTEKESCPLNGEELLEREIARGQEIIDKAGFKDKFTRRLVLAADAFIVQRRSTGAKSIIAGYHWFNDWGRDAMISLPGLAMVTKRFVEAREILLTFAEYCKDGLLPNMFPEPGEEPLYNTVDASLWFFQAVYKYLVYTGDYDFVREELYSTLKNIVECYIRGTHYRIKMDEDGLIRAGSPEVQLTWMDAKIDGFVVTPRQGRPVEINALWYNALCILKHLSLVFNDSFSYSGLISEVKSNFLQKFWHEEGNYLYDVAGENKDRADASFRPNQVMALCLPYAILDEVKGKKIIQQVWRGLYASYGLRSLSPEHRHYRGTYAGDRWERDLAYHQGTAWSWLIGPFITAFRRVYNYSAGSREQAARFIAPFRDHLNNSGIGFISEIFDGNEPVFARGCIAQAWGVAEVLRAYVEDVLEIRPPHERAWKEQPGRGIDKPLDIFR